jgi:ABC-type nitrate/sulfonate/bicarbonate transport system substrate-binding protein
MRRGHLRGRTVKAVGTAVLAALFAGPIAASSAATPATSASTTGASSTGHSLVSKARCAQNRAAGTMTFVSPFSFDASAGIIDVFAAQHLGYFADLCLDVKIIASSFTPNQLVSAGTATVTGEGSAADDLSLVANGQNLVAIATYGDTSDYALLTQTKFTKLTQLEGQTIGYHTTMPVILTEMLKKAGVDLSKTQLVNDTSYNPDLLPEGKFAAIQAYRSNEAITLREQHQGFREYVPSSYGVQGTFNVQVVNKSFLAKHPGAVTDFLRAELHAFDYCTTHALACVQLEDTGAAASGVENNQTHNLAEWKFEYALAIDHTLPGKGVGVETQAEWTPELDALKQFGIVKQAPSLSTYENTTIAASLYNGKTLIWPGS